MLYELNKTTKTIHEKASILNRTDNSIIYMTKRINIEGVKVKEKKDKVTIKGSICFKCKNANPLRCNWFACNIDDHESINLALSNKEYTQKKDKDSLIYSVNKCPNFIKG